MGAMIRLRHGLAWGLLLILVAACGGETGFAPAAPPTTVAALSAWWDKAGEVAFEAAPGVPVPQADLQLLLDRGLSDAEAREALALRKLLVKEAVAAGVADEFVVGHAFRRAMVQRFVKILFEEEHSAKQVPESVWREIFQDRAVFPLFDHQDTFFVVDAQFICCTGAPELCRKDTETQYCLQDYQADAWAVYESLKQGETADGEAAKERIEALKANFPTLALQEYSFQHDFDPANKGKLKFTIVDDAVANAAKATAVGTFGKPAQSAFGWHIVYVKRYLPEVHKSFGDPEVMAELEKRFYGLILRKDVMTYLGELFQQGQVEIFKDVIREVNWARVTGLR